MTRFSAKTSAEAVVAAPRQQIWDVLVDPDKIAALTPFLKRVTADGEHWRWEMSGLDVLGVKVAPAFTERMVFDDLERIEFHHDPPAGEKERSGVEGWYDLSDAPDGGTHLATSLEITLDLPLPKLSSPAVVATMKGVIGQMGDRFSANLLRELGIG
ncbi:MULTISPECIES: SRPBCC family protein [Nocardioides]|uniref:Polyketide cyclase / dehydrase and lipid transport n=1 Tax=Nocardioides lianchengensis TaxID=1045774 RepID=A0A1G6LY18_9ACTN|nr:SRPBCC family protein [Nocardioides lianchengensis]NYG12415.1 carbon monoxide dehydrogenase subunit G [Nocardioides lianchengensis]SDC47944.1 Polyketide cyclase / dehydrase and lipid transport [Nocardioides lianchengensis]